ncbi:DUF2256 domain-containing protein [Rhizobium quercicola]
MLFLSGCGCGLASPAMAGTPAAHRPHGGPLDRAHPRHRFPLMKEPRYTKSNLPTKICAACGRPFAWRKKWVRDWENVKTCSERCKGDVRRKASTGPENR